MKRQIGRIAGPVTLVILIVTAGVFIARLEPRSALNPTASQPLAAETGVVAASVASIETAPLAVEEETIEQEATLTPTSTPASARRMRFERFEMPNLAPVTWSEPPPCENRPLTMPEWQNRIRQDIESAEAKLLFERARRISPFVHDYGDAEQLIAVLLEDASGDETKALAQDLFALWLNALSGRINRATEIEVAELVDVGTVGDLIRLAEDLDALPTLSSVRDVIGSVLAGDAITNSVCANLLTFQRSGELQSILFNGSDIEQINLSPQDLIGEEARWELGTFHISPDYQKIAFDSGSYEGGGPVFIYDISSGSLTNLNLEVDLTLGVDSAKQDQKEWWQVIEWHPDSQHLLITDQVGAHAVWIDLNDKTFERFYLETEEQNVTLTAGSIGLLPTGQGFVYISSHRRDLRDSNQPLQYQWNEFDFATERSEVMDISVNPNERLFYPRISPSGDKMAFIVQIDDSSSDNNYALRVYDFESQEQTELASGEIGKVEPVWSPSGEQIAFPWSAPGLPDFHPRIPEADDWLGNLWVASLDTGEVRQVTFVDGAARRPVWSLDGEQLIFFTHDAQFGATALAEWEPWQITESIPAALPFGSAVYIP